MKRKLGLDVGDVRIGVAVSDLLNMIANPRETYTRKGLDEDVKYFVDYAAENDVDTIVLGLPVQMNGTEGDRVIKTRAFGDALAAASGLPLLYQDERLTTVQAQRVLIDADVRRDKRKKVVDKLAACLILQAYLDKSGK